jgi:uncharacterized membrane protein
LNPAVPGSTNRRAVRWLRNQLPELVSSGVISSENARAIEHHYESTESRSSFGFVLLAAVGSALIGAGIILLIAHNWDDLSRVTRTVLAFLPLVTAQALAVFVLLRRNESQAWRESVAIFDVAAVATAISLISQTYQIQGTFEAFLRVWLLLSIPIVYLLRSTLGAVGYVIGAVVWLFNRWSFFGSPQNPSFFWLLLLLLIPYFLVRYRDDRNSRGTVKLALVLALASVIGLGFTAEFTKSDLGGVAFAGLLTTIYLCGMKFFPRADERLSAVALFGGIGIGVTTIVLSFESTWRMTRDTSLGEHSGAGNFGLVLELLFPLVAIFLAGWDFFRKRRQFSVSAVAFPMVAAGAWAIANLCNHSDITTVSLPGRYVFNITSNCSWTSAIMINCYTLLLGVDILARGIHTNSIVRANFGLLLIAALAMSRFFDSDLSFLTRGVGFIVVGAGFLAANIVLFKNRTAT